MTLSSGSTVHPKCMEIYMQFKSNPNSPTHDFLTMKHDGNSIVLDLCPPFGETLTMEKYKNSEHPAFERMVDYLVENQCRYAFYIFDVATPESRRPKVVFYTYADDTAKPLEKMKYKTSKGAVEKVCPGFTVKIQANERDDLTYENGLAAVLSSK